MPLFIGLTLGGSLKEAGINPVICGTWWEWRAKHLPAKNVYQHVERKPALEELAQTIDQHVLGARVRKEPAYASRSRTIN